MEPLRSYLKLSCELDFYTLPNTKAITAKAHGEDYMTVRPPLVCHVFRNLLLESHLQHPLCTCSSDTTGTRVM